MTTDRPENWAVENATLKPEEAAQLNVYALLVPILGAVIITLNFVVAISSGLILRRGHQPRSTYLLLGNVAVADLVTGVAVILGATYPKQYRTEGSCSLQIGMIVSSSLTSIFSVGLIAVDRYLYILYGLKYQHWVYPNRVRLMILLIWIAALVVGFLPAFGWRGDTDGGRICWFILLAPPPLIIVVTSLGMFPVLLVIVLYSIILHRALQKVIQLREASHEQRTNNAPKPGSISAEAGGLRIFRGGIMPDNANTSAGSAAPPSGVLDQQHHQTQQQQRKTSSVSKSASWYRNKFVSNRLRPANVSEPVSKIKAIRVVLLTTGSFALTWLPYFVACSLYLYCDRDIEKQTASCRNLRFAIASPLALLSFVNSLLNPLIYAWWHRGFRRALARITRPLCGGCRNGHHRFNGGEGGLPKQQRKQMTERGGGPSATTKSRRELSVDSNSRTTVTDF